MVGSFASPFPHLGVWKVASCVKNISEFGRNPPKYGDSSSGLPNLGGSVMFRSVPRSSPRRFLVGSFAFPPFPFVAGTRGGCRAHKILDNSGESAKIWWIPVRNIRISAIRQVPWRSLAFRGDPRRPCVRSAVSHGAAFPSWVLRQGGVGFQK